MPCPARLARLATVAHLAVCGLVGAGSAWAQPGDTAAGSRGGVYGSIGLPGLIVGYAHPLNQRITVRGDVSTSGNWDRDVSEGGLDYQGSLRFNRLALLADYRVSPLFRLTAGITVNDLKARMHANGAGQAVQVGDNSYTLTAQDTVSAEVTFPKVTPYLGLGLGHYTGPDQPGWNVVADLGFSLGEPKVKGQATGPVGSTISQADIDKELQKLRDKVGKVDFVPQLSIGATYRY